MSTQPIHDFGLVDEKGDAFEFIINVDDRSCRLVAVLQTERGPRRTEVAAVSIKQWNAVAIAAVRELAAEMGETEREKRSPSLRPGLNRISPLVGRELGVLLISLMEDGAAERVDALLHAWRELAREERWWLYSKAAAPGQRVGVGWRKALFHALSETSDTRVAPLDEEQKKNFGSIANLTSRERTTKTQPRNPSPTIRPTTPSPQPQPKRKQPTSLKRATKSVPPKASPVILSPTPSHQPKSRKKHPKPDNPSAKSNTMRKTTR
jgi:hypothetical protein